jgi:hypothetical protein
MKKHRILWAVKILLFVVAALTVFSFVAMWLWNHLMPAIFGLHAISFWQALGLLVLSRLLFGRFRGRPGFGWDWRARFAWNLSPEGRERFRAGLHRWHHMTPEEREKFRAEMCSPRGPSVPATDAPKA